MSPRGRTSNECTVRQRVCSACPQDVDETMDTASSATGRSSSQAQRLPPCILSLTYMQPSSPRMRTCSFGGTTRASLLASACSIGEKKYVSDELWPLIEKSRRTMKDKDGDLSRKTGRGGTRETNWWKFRVVNFAIASGESMIRRSCLGR